MQVQACLRLPAVLLLSALAGCTALGMVDFAGLTTANKPATGASPGESGGSQPGNVNKHDKAPAKIEVSQATLVIPVKNTKTLTANVTYTDGTKDSSVKWSSSDETILTIDPNSGALTANKEGQATIIAAAINNSNVQAQIDVTVRADGASDLIVRVSPTAGAIKVGETLQLSATIQDSEGSQGGNVLWGSSNRTVVEVNAQGLVTGIGFGSATITASSQKDPTRKASAGITVIE